MNTKKHAALTGVPNELLLENFKRLQKCGKQIIIRVPVVPTFNDDSENIQALIKFLVKNAPGILVDLIPYHRLGKTKYHRLHMEYHLGALEPLPVERIEEIKQLFEKAGFKPAIDG